MFKRAADRFLIKTDQIKRLLRVAAPELHLQDKLQTFRTGESDPTNHTPDHLGMFYQMPLKEKNILFQHGGVTKTFDSQTKIFNETCLMVRQPALDVINCLKTLDYNLPTTRFVMFGKKGSGKTISLAHILHYAIKNRFLIIHVPWVTNWMLCSKDSSNSETKEGFIDLNMDAAAWLLHFKTQNAEILKQPHLKVTRDIQWTKRELTPKGASLLELVEHGINRIRFASMCVSLLAEEIKLASLREPENKVMVAIDGFNAFFHPKTKVFTEKKEMVPPSRITLTEPFLNLTRSDWKNAVVVVTVDQLSTPLEDQVSHLPRYLLKKDGFEHMDPFVPVEVPEYSPKEHQSIMEYYRERKWVQPYQGQDEELYFLSGANPHKLVNLCRAL